MSTMQITTRQVFNADPTTTVAMLCNSAFLEELCSRTDATSHSVQVAGNNTRMEMVVPAPPEAATFVGSSLDVTQTVEWGDLGADGSRNGTFKVELAKLPVNLSGTVTAVPDAATTVVTYDGELTVNIPIIGKSLEKTAAPGVVEALEAQEAVGNEWLAAHPA